MTVFFTAVGALLVLAGVAKALRNRVAAPAAGLGGRYPAEVLRRVALTQKQGIAIVRLGDRVVAVSIGDGGVRPLYDLDPDEIVELPSKMPSVFESALGKRIMEIVGRIGPKAAALILIGLPIGLLAMPGLAWAQDAAAAAQGLAPQLDVRLGTPEEGLHLSGTVGVVVMMGLLTLLPTLVMMMTAFPRLIMVFSFLKQGLGTATAPPALLVAALALILTGFVMRPTFSEVDRVAVEPWLAGQIDEAEMLKRGIVPFRAWMSAQMDDDDVEPFVQMAELDPAPATPEAVPLTVLLAAFVVHELAISFQIGFIVLLGFAVIDIAVATVLMSLGFFMLPPALISLPIKMLVFVLVDGWILATQSVLATFR